MKSKNTIRIDFHIHTKYSPDSLTSPKKLADKASRLGIIPAVTDHNSIQAHQDMHDLGADFIPGEEIFTDKGDLVGLYLNELIPKKTPFLEAIDKIHEQGGLAYIPHMFDRGRSGKYASEKEARKVDIVEVFNARCMGQELNEKAHEFAVRNKMVKAAGSDSHFLFEFGKTYTELPEFDITNPKALLKALCSRSAKLITKKGPIYARGTTRIIYFGKKIARHLKP